MDRFAFSARSIAWTRSIAWIGLFTFAGCGKAPQTAENAAEQVPSIAASEPKSDQSPSLSANTVPQPGSPMDVVSQFLDEIRRGGEDVRANDLLTSQAQIELQRIGQSVQPIGSPDARFEVTRYEQVPQEPGSALVHSIWSEPNGDGTNSDFQVVWAVEKEAAGWRISGLAMELDPSQPPLIIDFENAELMAKLLAVPGEANGVSEPPSGGAATGPQIAEQPAGADAPISR